MDDQSQPVQGHHFHARPLGSTAHKDRPGRRRDACPPDHVVDEGRAIVLRLRELIEAERPSDLADPYGLTHVTTEEFNLLDAEFAAAGSELEAVAREEIAENL
ncbi:DUF5713 family protein [Streptomyces marianii]|uniref:DUF5713 family protein n=1 Tax=Streptomyces marianii TaxID=1817406 RepID=UPI0026AF0EB0